MFMILCLRTPHGINKIKLMAPLCFLLKIRLGTSVIDHAFRNLSSTNGMIKKKCYFGFPVTKSLVFLVIAKHIVHSANDLADSLPNKELIGLLLFVESDVFLWLLFLFFYIYLLCEGVLGLRL